MVGVVADVNRQGVDQPTTPEMYFSPLQSGITNAQVVTLTDGDMVQTMAAGVGYPPGSWSRAQVLESFLFG